ncbi:MAG: hypothetical protein HDS48_00610 [Bacteroides sp.]|nr:hypothetical protein [Bacteroides sp.]MDE6077809.1 hypothetical protein [Muribaculaceae bacterium]MDE6423761.1 hypothetical protein [Muribaculaceae bacterium]
MDDQQYKFDEDEAVKFIRASIPEDISDKYDDDDILCIIDIIWDYYEKKGFLSLNLDETDEEVLDTDDLTKYVKKEVKNDKDLLMDPKDIELIVKAELNYEESLEDFV